MLTEVQNGPICETNKVGWYYIAKDNTYFNHPAKTPYEKCVEACYFFNKATNSKQECLQKAQELWKSKYNDQALKTYIEKHETALKSRSVRVTKSFNIRAEKQ